MELINGFTEKQIASCVSPRRLQLTILPTEKCNFRCTYCYEDFLIGRMSKAVVGGIKELISTRAPEIENLVISWFGGEPLLADKVVLEISQHAFRLSEEYDFVFSGGLTTNAYRLDKELLMRLVDCGQRSFQVTLDGWEDGHDRTRRRADGKGTFDVIWANMLSAKTTDLDFEWSTRVHLTHDNQLNLQVLCFRLGHFFGDDARFTIDYQDVRNLGGAGGETIVDVGPKSFKSRIAVLEHFRESGANGEEFERIEPPVSQVANDIEHATSNSESSSSRQAYLTRGGTPYICYASKPNYFLIRADGRLGKCTVALSDARNTIGSINPDGSLNLDQDLIRRWSGGINTLDVEQMGCPIQFLPRQTDDSQSNGSSVGDQL